MKWGKEGETGKKEKKKRTGRREGGRQEGRKTFTYAFQ